MQKVSIIIRTLNEEKHLEDLLVMISRQKTKGITVEVIIVDSGSKDQTCNIARRHGCRIVCMKQSEFTFGRSLNLGCAKASGDIFVFISGHCIPVNNVWLQQLCDPIYQQKVDYCYGRQVGDDTNHFSERRLFARYFPASSQIPQDGYFCNNANSAITRAAWDAYKFDEKITGLEDMELAKRLTDDGKFVGYSSNAIVFHHHSETGEQIRNRFKREGQALQSIENGYRITLLQLFRFVILSIYGDLLNAIRLNSKSASWISIFVYRINQYWGAYSGVNSVKKPQKKRCMDYYRSTTEKNTDTDAWLGPLKRLADNDI